MSRGESLEYSPMLASVAVLTLPINCSTVYGVKVTTGTVAVTGIFTYDSYSSCTYLD